MKKASAIILLLFTIAVFTGCGIESEIDDLLVNPSLSGEQKKIMDVVDSLSEGDVILKYPLSGDSRLPIIFFDLDRDGADEAVVFYSIPSGSVFSGIAVLEKENGVWFLSDNLEGAGPDASSVRFLPGDSGDYFLLVCWSSGNREQILTSYYYGKDGLVSGIEENCADFIIRDFDSDGIEEICYISTLNDDWFIKYIEGLSLDELIYSQCILSSRTMAISQLLSGQLYDGTAALFIDEATLEEKKQTEIFVFPSEQGISPAYIGGKYLDLTLRPYKSPSCHSIRSNQSISVPSTSVPFDDVLYADAWTYWYGFSMDNVEFSALSLSNSDYRFDLLVPDDWALENYVDQETGDGTLFRILSNDGKNLFELKVQYIGDTEPADDDYHLLEQSVYFKYYYRSSCDFSDLGYIIRNFVAY